MAKPAGWAPPDGSPVGSEGDERARLLARWSELTRRVLPGMAAAQGWPIRLDHCFMRVCLDDAFGRPWHEAIPRPAVRRIPLAALARAVATAERLRDAPADLPALNRASLRLRGHPRRG